MACITERKRAKSPNKWEAVIRMAGREVRKIFDDKASAERFVLQTESDMRKQHTSEKAKLEKLRKKEPGYADFYGRKLRDVIIEFGAPPQDEPQIPPSPKTTSQPKILNKKKSVSKVGRDIGRHRGVLNTVLDHIGQVTIADAKGSWVGDYVERMRKTKSKTTGRVYSYGSISNHLALMTAACKRAADKADIDDVKLHFTRKSFPKNWIGKRERRVEEWEGELILDHLRKDETVRGQHWLLLYQLALETAARLQELVLAEWGEIKQSGAVWVIPKEHTKTRTMRNVSLTPEARSIIGRLKALASPTSPLIFHSLGTVASVSQGFKYRVKKAGVTDLHFHDLRHEAISRLVVHPSKPPLQAIMSMVGHKSYEMISHYTHLREAEFSRLFG